MTLSEIELYFETFGYPDVDIELSQGVKVVAADSKLFVDSTIHLLKYNSGNLKFMPDWRRLILYYNKASYLRTAIN